MSGEDTEGLAVLDDHDRIALAERLEGVVEAFAGAEQRQRRLHVLGDGVGELRATLEHGTDQGVIVDAARNLTDDDRRLGADDGHLRDVVLAQDLDRVADRLRRVRVNQRRHAAGLAAEQVADGDLVDVAVERLAEEAVGRHPVVVEDLGEVAATAVGEQHDDDGVGSGLLGDLQGGHDGHTAGAADEEAFFAGEPTRHVERVGIGDGDDLVWDRGS